MKCTAKILPVYYTHTNRFHQELISFLVHIVQLLEVAQRGYSSGVAESQRAARILLNIELERPVVILPESGYTDRVLLLDLGYINLTNQFLPDPTGVMLDTMHVSLSQLHFATGHRTSMSRLSDETTPLTVQPFNISLKMLRNLDKDLRKPVPDTQVFLRLEGMYFELDQEQYWVVRGMLDHNLGEPMPEFVRPEFLKHLEEFTESDKEKNTKKFGVWQGMYINLAMKNVKIELGYGHRYKGLEEYKPQVQFNFGDCVLEFTGNSDTSKKTELKCKDFSCYGRFGN